MAVSGSALATLILADVDSRMAAVAGHHPLQQRNTHYYTEMCEAIGNGIINGAQTISFTTTDAGLAGVPLVAGVGAGIGIVTDPTWFVQDLYTRIRNYVIQDFGKTLHDPYLPGPGNSGQYLLALCQGINDAFLGYYPTAWTLVSAHPQIYTGTGLINDGQFSGLSASAIQADIIAGAPDFMGRFWPRLAQAISESYVGLIEQHSTGMVTITGTCVINIAPPQTCGITGVGAGSGVAS